MKWKLIHNGTIKLKLADQISIRTKNSAFSWAIRWFTQRIGEKKTFSNHDAGISKVKKTSEGYIYNIIEAIKGKVRENNLYEALDNNKHATVIARYRSFQELQRVRVISNVRRESLGNIYSAIKIGCHVVDNILSKIFFKDITWLSRFHLKISEICTTVWTIPLGYEDVYFGVYPKACNPDIKLDYILSHPIEWEIIFMDDEAERILSRIGQYPEKLNIKKEYLEYEDLIHTETHKERKK